MSQRFAMITAAACLAGLFMVGFGEETRLPHT
jgi:hypothetical protein